MQKFPLLVLTVLMYCDSSYSYQHEYVEDQIIWLDNGEVCEKEYTPDFYCVHFSFCLPNGDAEPKGHAEFCDYVFGWKRMCCVANAYVPYNPLDTDDPYIYNISGSEIQQPSIENAENRQTGGNGNTGPVGPIPDSQGSVIRNVTINLPFVPPTPETSISFRKCREYTLQTKPNPFVTLGRAAFPGEFPHMGLLGYGESNNTQWKCGGSLISTLFVLTAAHCKFFRPFGQVKYVRFGSLSRNPPILTRVVTVGVETFIRHPSYSFKEKYHDIALIKMNRTFYWTDRLFPACLATRWELDNINLIVSGWGATTYQDDDANVLMAGDLRYVPNDRCRMTYGQMSDYREGIVETLQICADGGAIGTDACTGDSGGPLQFNNTFYDFKFVEIAGVVSFGINCGKVPGVYTRVLPYVPWIEGHVWPNETVSPN